MTIYLTTDDDSQGCLALEDGEWFFAREVHSHEQPQQRDRKSDETDDEKDKLHLPERMQLRKAEREQLIEFAAKHCVTVDPEEAAKILNLVRDTVYRMVDRGTLGRIPDIRHVKIPLSHVMNVAQGLNKDGSKP